MVKVGINHSNRKKRAIFPHQMMLAEKKINCIQTYDKEWQNIKKKDFGNKQLTYDTECQNKAFSFPHFFGH